MPKRIKYRGLIKEILSIMLIIVVFLILRSIEQTKIKNDEINDITFITANESKDVILEGKKILQIHFFNVGQADSILLISNQNTMLIDAGNSDDGNLIVNNIKKLGINKIDYLIATHPHEDHIGGMSNIIRNFDIGTVYMPKISTNTKTFEDMINSIEEKNIEVISPEVGTTFMVGDAKCEVMLCGDDSNIEKENLNLSSLVVRTTYNQQSYLFMGDSEEENENSRKWAKTNVIKIGHHGSDTSTSEEFLNQILPEIAVISVGKNNGYNHPNKVVLDRLKNRGTIVYRTDKKGNILIESDGIKNRVSFY